MAQEIEIEFKNLLTKTEYNRLLNDLPFPSESIVQINHYFETEDFSLQGKHAALRIREKDGKYVMTLKEPHPEGLLETHDEMTKQEAESWINGTPIPKEHTGKQLEALGISIDQLNYCGSLMTERREIEYGNVLLVLDYSKYNNHEDYELEMEAKSRREGELIFKEFLSKYAISQRKTMNKIERFFHSVKEGK